MAKPYLIGVDLRTSSTKATLYTTEGNLVAESTVEVPIYYLKPGESVYSMAGDVE